MSGGELPFPTRRGVIYLIGLIPSELERERRRFLRPSRWGQEGRGESGLILPPLGPERRNQFHGELDFRKRTEVYNRALAPDQQIAGTLSADGLGAVDDQPVQVLAL